MLNICLHLVNFCIAQRLYTFSFARAQGWTEANSYDDEHSEGHERENHHDGWPSDPVCHDRVPKNVREGELEVAEYHEDEFTHELLSVAETIFIYASEAQICCVYDWGMDEDLQLHLWEVFERKCGGDEDWPSDEEHHAMGHTIYIAVFQVYADVHRADFLPNLVVFEILEVPLNHRCEE